MNRLLRTAGMACVGLGSWLAAGAALEVSAAELSSETSSEVRSQATTAKPARPQWAAKRARMVERARWQDPLARAQSQRAAHGSTGTPTVAQPARHRVTTHDGAVEMDIQLNEGETLVSTNNQPVSTGNQRVTAGHKPATARRSVNGNKAFASSSKTVASRSNAQPMIDEGEQVQPFNSELEPLAVDGFQDTLEGCEDCEGDVCDETNCHKTCICIDWCWFEDLGVFGGVHGFKGPVDLGTNGNFGFHHGLNWGGPLFPKLGVGFQLGFQTTHSNFSGDDQLFLAGEERTQVFGTAGVFHRAMCGLQWGVAVDSLHDEYYLDMELGQIRGEIGFVGPCQNELGVMFTSGNQDDTQTGAVNIFGVPGVPFTETWTPTDLAAIYYRRHFCAGAEARAWVGGSGEGDGLVGGDFHIPLSHCWALESRFAYLIPEEGGRRGAREESWGLSINVAWYPARAFCCRPQHECWGSVKQYRPLMGVADNSTFMVDRAGGLDAFLP